MLETKDGGDVLTDGGARRNFEEREMFLILILVVDTTVKKSVETSNCTNKGYLLLILCVNFASL